MLTTCWIVVTLAYCPSVGLSRALGAFVAGMLIRRPSTAHQVKADIKPFRDVLLGLLSSPSA